MEQKSTVGAFTRYCGGKVTSDCIQRGLKSKNPTIRKRAAFAKAARKVAKKKELGGLLDDVDKLYMELGGCINCIEEYALGGLVTEAGQLNPLVGIAASVIGGLGSAMIEKNKAVNEFKNSLNTNTLYEHGGMLEGRKDALEYEGPSHEQGGIPIDDKGNPVSMPTSKEVEGDEVVVNIDGKKYIFSKKLKI